MDFEDLRDYQKSTQKSNHVRIKSNGATYSYTFRNMLYKNGNYLIKDKGVEDSSANELDEKFCINSNNLAFSLNKKGRWKMINELKSKMNDFSVDDEDVRLYETRNRIKNRTNNCVDISKSKGENIKVQSTYANTRSIIKNQKIALKNQNEHLKNDTSSNAANIDDNYTQYTVEYAPKDDVLKYTALLDFNNKDRVSSKKVTNVLGDEHLERKIDYFDDDIQENDFDNDDTIHLQKRPVTTFGDILTSNVKVMNTKWTKV